MIVSELFVNGLRNLENKHLLFNDKKNLIYGNNGIGKTSILESLFLLGFKKSFLNVRIRDIVNYNKQEFFIKAKIITKTKGIFELKGIYSKKKFNLFLSNKETSIMEINNYYYPLFFSSSNYIQYIENNNLLRKLIDRFIFGLNTIYYSDLINYNRALKNKNYLLKTSFSKIELNSWNKVLSELVFEIMKKRIFFISKLNNILKNFDKNMEIIYIPSFSTNEFNSEKIYFEFENLKSKEIILKRTMKGTHIDKYTINKNNKNLKYFSSGEKKIGLLLIYISFIELYNNTKNEYPVFFTDDFDTAIDKNNIEKILNNYPNLQVISTSVNKNDNFDKYINLGYIK